MEGTGDLRKLFDSLDLNKNGVLTRGELITALRVKGRNANIKNEISFWGFKDYDEVAEFFDVADVDHNKELTFEEFQQAFSNRKQ